MGEMKITLMRHTLRRKLTPEQMNSAADALYGKPPEKTTPTEQDSNGEEPPVEETEALQEEAADQSEAEGAAEEGGPEESPSQESPAGNGTQPEHYCNCGQPLTEANIAYCQSPAGLQKFAGVNLCFSCQKATLRAAKGGSPAKASAKDGAQ